MLISYIHHAYIHHPYYDIVDIEEPDGICSPTFPEDRF